MPKISKTRRFIISHVKYVSNECLLWPHGKDSLGYGRACVPGFTTRLAHRIMCEMVHGAPPFDGAVARHLCGKGHDGCVNPCHLAWGTILDNAHDAVAAGRIARGERSGAAVLTDAAVRGIRAMIEDGLPQRVAAEHFKVSPGTVQAVVEGRTWRHVQ